MNKEQIKSFFERYRSLKLNHEEKQRILELFQVKDINGSLKVMSYKEFKILLKNKKGRITELVMGPKWSPLVFVDINVMINE